MKHVHSLPFLALVALTLSACVPPSPHGGDGGHTQTATSNNTRDLTINDRSTDGEIAFAVQENDAVFTDYGVSHTKEMHLIVVRDDLQHFQHLHPERDSDGILHIAFTSPAGGTYWRYADFVDTDEKTYTIRFDRTHAGDLGKQGIAKDFSTVKIVDGYRFELLPAPTGKEISFTYNITNAQGNRITPEPYLGAQGHSVIISPSGDFIHAHPSEEGASLTFATTLPANSFHRMFTQFQIKGKVVTVVFDWKQ